MKDYLKLLNPHEILLRDLLHFGNYLKLNIVYLNRNFLWNCPYFDLIWFLNMLMMNIQKYFLNNALLLKIVFSIVIIIIAIILYQLISKFVEKTIEKSKVFNGKKNKNIYKIS